MKLLIKIGLAILCVAAFSFRGLSQNTCADFMKFRAAAEGFKASTQSKSGKCFSGKSYKFMLPIVNGKVYRISFYASAAFNQEIHFKVIDQSTGKSVIDVDGASDPNDPNKPGALGEMEEEGKFVHTYYEFEPSAATTLQIVIDVKKAETPKPIEGCIGIFVQEKPAVIEW